MVIKGDFYVYFKLNLHSFGQLVVYCVYCKTFLSCYSTIKSIFSKLSSGKLFAIASKGEKEFWKSDNYKL